MLGKAVRIRHCPATVIGTHSGRIRVTAQAGRQNPVFKSKTHSPGRKSGDRFLDDLEPVDRLEGERLMTFLLLSIVRGTVRIQNALDRQYQEVLGYLALSRTATGGLRIT